MNKRIRKKQAKKVWEQSKKVWDEGIITGATAINLLEMTIGGKPNLDASFELVPSLRYSWVCEPPLWESQKLRRPSKT